MSILCWFFVWEGSFVDLSDKRQDVWMESYYGASRPRGRGASEKRGRTTKCTDRPEQGDGRRSEDAEDERGKESHLLLSRC